MARTSSSGSGMVRVLAYLVIAAGVVLAAAGVVTWIAVHNTLADERITVSADADHFAGDKVDGPLTAYSEAQTIEKHALEASGGKTYAELPRDDPRRNTVMTASFLRASLFTSVVSFGLAAMALGLGIVFILIGFALLRLARGYQAPAAVAPAAAAPTAAAPAPTAPAPTTAGPPQARPAAPWEDAAPGRTEPEEPA
jgi:hypothetical protein